MQRNHRTFSRTMTASHSTPCSAWTLTPPLPSTLLPYLHSHSRCPCTIDIYSCITTPRPKIRVCFANFRLSKSKEHSVITACLVCLRSPCILTVGQHFDHANELRAIRHCNNLTKKFRSSKKQRQFCSIHTYLYENTMMRHLLSLPPHLPLKEIARSD